MFCLFYEHAVLMLMINGQSASKVDQKGTVYQKFRTKLQKSAVTSLELRNQTRINWCNNNVHACEPRPNVHDSILSVGVTERCMIGTMSMNVICIQCTLSRSTETGIIFMSTNLVIYTCNTQSPTCLESESSTGRVGC